MDERLEYWLEQIVSKLGQLVYVGEKFCQRHAGHDFVLPPESDLRVMTFGKAIQKATDHFADANKMVSEEPAKEPVEPPQPEYREPVLPADFCKPCEFSITGKDWYESLLAGFQAHRNPWISSDQGRWNYARIKKDA